MPVTIAMMITQKWSLTIPKLPRFTNMFYREYTNLQGGRKGGG